MDSLGTPHDSVCADDGHISYQLRDRKIQQGKSVCWTSVGMQIESVQDFNFNFKLRLETRLVSSCHVVMPKKAVKASVDGQWRTLYSL